MRQVFGSLIVVALALSGLADVRGQGAPPAYTTIVVETMHCDGCAKRMGAQLQTVAGVAKIQYDVEKKTLWVHPKPGTSLSARGLWEAVEKGNDRPVLLQGPSGTFKQKPNS